MMNYNETLKIEYEKICERYKKRAEKEFQDYLNKIKSVILYMKDKESVYFHKKPSRYAYNEYVDMCLKNNFNPIGKKDFSWQIIKFGKYNMKSVNIGGHTMRVFILKDDGDGL